jgi:hypothetical protein
MLRTGVIHRFRVGRAQGDGPGLQFGFRNAVSSSWFHSGWLLSPLFHEDDQIFIFPAPIRYSGDPYLPAVDGHLHGKGGVFPSRSPVVGSSIIFMECRSLCKVEVTTRQPKCAFLAASNIRYAPRYRSLICYRYRCALGWIRLISRREFRVEKRDGEKRDSLTMRFIYCAEQ